ncbi:MAG: hydroxypyruvate reductase [Gammaproteobacteria bacterium]|nr:MAG: hydroxypyruvate reductase [Gammaproteobacteria bacterium]
MTELTARELLIMLYETALDAVDGRYLVNQWCHAGSNKKSFTHCVAIGKASAAMLQGALDNFPALKKSLLICPPSKITRQFKKNKSITSIASSHPVPDESSIEAGQALISFLAGIDESDEILFLISGGSSSLVEIPVDNISLDQLQQINRYLLASGKDIHQINAWRQRFSKIKGGGLLNYIKSTALTQLLLSDVKGDSAEIIGSGLLVEATSQAQPDEYLSGFIAQTNQDDDAQSVKSGSSIHVDTFIIGNNKLAMQAAYEAAKTEGLASFIYDEFIEGDACQAAERLYKLLKDAEPGIHVLGGETTVKLPESPGIGGRNQTLALAFARLIADDPDLHLLAAGTDGVDGNSSCAGAVVSKYTSIKAGKMGFDINAEIEKANAGLLLMATDDLVNGDNSNTNVMDIIIVYRTQ